MSGGGREILFEEFKAGSILNVCLTYPPAQPHPGPTLHLRESGLVLQFSAGSPASVTCVWHVGAGQGVMSAMGTLLRAVRPSVRPSAG